MVYEVCIIIPVLLMVAHIARKKQGQILPNNFINSKSSDVYAQSNCDYDCIILPVIYAPQLIHISLKIPLKYWNAIHKNNL